MRLSVSMVVICGALTSLLPFAAAAETQAPVKEDTWQVIMLSGQRIGYAHLLIEPVEQDGQTIVRTSTLAHMTIRRFGQSLVMKQTLTTEETINGDLLRFRFEMANPPASSTSTVGIVKGDQLNLQQSVNGKQKESSQAWRSDIKSPSYQDRVLRKSPLKKGESRTFEAFMPEFNKVSSIKITADDLEDTTMLDGKSQRLMKVRMTQSLVPGLTLNGFVDEAGETLKTTTTLLGVEMVTYRVSKEEAQKTIAGEELDLAVSTLVKVKKIADASSLKKIRYRIVTRGQNPEAVLPSSEGQVVRKTGDDVAEVTVSALPIPATAMIRQIDREFLAASQFLQSDDAAVKEHALKARGDARDPAEVARRMERYVHDKLTSKNFSTAMASAGEVARNLEGDCTEHAVLLAAMLRSAEIPSRVAVGLVYVDSLSAFGGHMWTEACLDGRWIPLDATLGRGGTGIGHLKLSDSSLSDDGPSALSSFAPLMLVIGQMQIEVLE